MAVANWRPGTKRGWSAVVGGASSGTESHRVSDTNKPGHQQRRPLAADIEGTENWMGTKIWTGTGTWTNRADKKTGTDKGTRSGRRHTGSLT